MTKFSERNFVSYLTTCKTKNGKLLSKDGYATKKSCVFHLYRCAEIVQPPEVKNILTQSVAGFTR